MGKARDDVPPPDWPCMTDDEFQALRPKVKARLGRVARGLVDENFPGRFWGPLVRLDLRNVSLWEPLAREALKSAWWFKGGAAVDAVMKYIRKDLTDRGLLGR
jgi:hypothetical protein